MRGIEKRQDALLFGYEKAYKYGYNRSYGFKRTV